MTKSRSVHIKIDDDLYREVWKLVSEKYDNPSRSFHLIVDKALRMYLKKVKKKKEKR